MPLCSNFLRSSIFVTEEVFAVSHGWTGIEVINIYIYILSQYISYSFILKVFDSNGTLFKSTRLSNATDDEEFYVLLIF